jgi:hypothetical protein
LTNTATVSITVTGLIWFIDNSAASNGDGRLGTPFNSLANFNSGAADDPGDNIFLYRQAATNYTGGITLLANQKLIGQGATTTLVAITGLALPTFSNALPSVGGTRPTLTHTANNVTLGAGNTLRGLNIQSTGGSALFGTSFSGLNASENTATATGGTAAVNLDQTGAAVPINVNFISVTASGSTNGIILADTTGSFTVAGTGGTCTSAATCTGGAIQNSGQDAVRLSNATNITLTDMYIFTSAQSWIDATTVNGLTLTRLNADLSTDHGLLASSLRNLVVQGGTFNRGAAGNGSANFDGFHITNLLGTSSIADALFQRSNTRQVYIVNNTATNAAPGTPDILTVSNNDFNTHTGPFSGDHVNVSADTGGNFRLIVNNTGGANICKTGGICVQAAGAGSGKMDAQISGIISGGNNGVACTTIGACPDANTAGVAVAGTASSNVTFNVSNNTMLGTGSLGMTINDFTSGTFSGTVQANTIAHIAGGGTDAFQIVSHGAPGLRLGYNPDFYAAYVRDPDGNKIAAVCRGFTTAQDS